MLRQQEPTKLLAQRWPCEAELGVIRDTRLRAGRKVATVHVDGEQLESSAWVQVEYTLEAELDTKLVRQAGSIEDGTRWVTRGPQNG